MAKDYRSHRIWVLRHSTQSRSLEYTQALRDLLCKFGGKLPVCTFSEDFKWKRTSRANARTQDAKSSDQFVLGSELVSGGAQVVVSEVEFDDRIAALCFTMQTFGTRCASQ